MATPAAVAASDAPSAQAQTDRLKATCAAIPISAARARRVLGRMEDSGGLVSRTMALKSESRAPDLWLAVWCSALITMAP
jgi:hypothetical protein